MIMPTAKQITDCKTINDLFRDHAKRFAGLTREMQASLLADCLLFYGGMSPDEVTELGNHLQRQAWNVQRMNAQESR